MCGINCCQQSNELLISSGIWVWITSAGYSSLCLKLTFWIVSLISFKGKWIKTLQSFVISQNWRVASGNYYATTKSFHSCNDTQCIINNFGGNQKVYI